MKTLLKGGLVLLSLPVLGLVGAFIYGMVLEATHPTGPSPAPAAPAAPAAPDASEPATVSQESVGSTTRTLEPLPEDLDAHAAQEWIFANGLIGLEGGELVADEASYRALSAELAARVHHALRKGGQEVQSLRLHFFALCHLLPLEEREAFAEEVGAVFRPDHGASTRGYIGDFTKLFWLQTDDADSLYARAVRGYAPVLESDAVIQAMVDFGAIKRERDFSDWFIRIEEHMQEFDADTLLALREAVDPRFGVGDLAYVREDLAELAESKR